MEQVIFSTVEIRPKATNSGGLRWLCLKKFYRTAIILLCGLTYSRAITPHIFRNYFHPKAATPLRISNGFADATSETYCRSSVFFFAVA